MKMKKIRLLAESGFSVVFDKQILRGKTAEELVYEIT